MSDFTLYILTSLALVFVLEGMIYALFPDLVRKIMAMALMMPVSQLRLFGFAMLSTGVFVTWLLQVVI